MYFILISKHYHIDCLTLVYDNVCNDFHSIKSIQNS